MKDSLTNEEHDGRNDGHLALATQKLQGSLPVSDTPLLVEELLEEDLSWADYQLRELARPRIRWYC